MKSNSNIVFKIVFAILAVLVINWIASSFYTRFDLTEDKRYTLSDETIDFIENLQDTVRFTVYLEGDLPITYTKLQKEVKDLLFEFKRIGGNKIEILFIDPKTIGAKGNKANYNAFNKLAGYGLRPKKVAEEDENGKFTERLILPGMIISTIERPIPVNFLSDVLSTEPEQQVKEAIDRLEYSFIKGLKQLVSDEYKNIAFLTDQKELRFLECYDATMSLNQFYNIDRINTQQLLDSINKYDAVIIAKPQSEFSEKDKFILDQYLMRNGNLLALVDLVDINQDTLKYVSEVTAMYNDLNFADFLFNLGVRIQPDVILDNNCAKIPLNMAQPGMPAQFAPAPWYYYPLLRGNKDNPHPIDNKIDVVKAQFANPIELVEGNGNLKKTVLLTTSAYTRSVQAPTQVGFSIFGRVPNIEYFKESYLPVAGLIEGNLESLYKTRSAPISKSELPSGFEIKKGSEHNKIIVVGDGDIIKNEIEVQNFDSIPKPLHYYKYFKIDGNAYTGNKEFLLNAVNYLCGDTTLIPLRSREFKIRLLNKNRIIEERTNWQLLNIVIPIILLIISGLVIFFVRKQKFAKHVS